MPLYAALIALSGGSNSVYFVLLFFAILAASRDGFGAGIKVTAVCVVLFVLISIVEGSLNPDFDLNGFLIRSSYLSSGDLDTSYGERGSSQAPPASAAASAHDAAVLDDGRISVLEQIEDTGLPRPALWFVNVGGRFEPDWLQWADTTSASAMSLTLTDGGAVMVALGVPRPPTGTLEAFILVPTRDTSAIPERLVQNALPKGWGEQARLERSDKGRWLWSAPDSSDRTPLRATASTDTDNRPLWAWRKGALPAPTPVAAVAPTPTVAVATPMNSANDPGGAMFTPFVEQPPVRIAAGTGDASVGDGPSITTIGWSITGLLMAGVALMVLFRRPT